MKLVKQDAFIFCDEEISDGIFKDNENTYELSVKEIKNIYILTESDIQKLKEEYYGIGMTEAINNRSK